MGRILEARGDEALDVLAELLDPVTEIAQDKEIAEKLQKGSTASLGSFAREILKRHKSAVFQIMAIDDGKTVEEERTLLSPVTIPLRLIALLNNPAVGELLFGSAATTGENGSSAASESGNG